MGSSKKKILAPGTFVRDKYGREGVVVPKPGFMVATGDDTVLIAWIGYANHNLKKVSELEPFEPLP